MCSHQVGCPAMAGDSVTRTCSLATSPVKGRRAASAVLVALLAIAITLLGPRSEAAAQEWQRTRSSYVGMPERKAILIVSSDLSNPARSAGLQASVQAYRDRLDDLGFDTVVLGPASRPALDHAIREVPTGVQPGGEVAVFVVGPTLSGTNDLYLMPSDAAVDLSPASPSIEPETLGLSFVLRRLKASAPREIVVVVDECHAPTTSTCVPAYLRETSIQSLVAARGAQESRDDATEATLRRATLEAMTVEGDTFEQFRDHLAAETAPSGLRIESNQPLSRTFSFFQRGHFQRVSETCFRIDPDANEAAAQDSRISTWTQTCEADSARWPFVDALRVHAAAGREQVAFQLAVTPPCQNSARAQQYLATYNNGRYATAVRKFLDQCLPQAPSAANPAPSSPSPAPPPSIPVRWYRGMDAWGNDFGAWLSNVPNAEDCMRLCVQNSGCVGATYNIRRSVCIRKSRITNLINARDDAITGVLTDRTPAPDTIAGTTPRVRHYENLDATGNDRGSWIRGVSSADCESICIADSGCAGYTYNRLRATCIPKSVVVRLMSSGEPAVTGVVEGR